MIVKRMKHVLLIFAIAAVFSLLAVQIPFLNQSIATGGKEAEYILDAGHGKPDGGTVGKDGTTEEELNLTVTLKISDFLTKSNKKHILTRTTEDSIYTDGNTIHAKKVSDIKERVKIASEYPQVPLVSIHMNSFPNESVRGIQVFYKGNDEHSKKLAQSMQQSINDALQPENAKTIKVIPQNVYLFSHVENPCVLIECGFLSNPSELEQLKSEEYQSKIACVISQVLIDFKGKKE